MTTQNDEKYDFPSEDEPLRQGDILSPVPQLVPISLTESIYTYNSSGQEITTAPVAWEEVSNKEDVYSVKRGIVPSKGIIVSQDCDAFRNKTISLCLIQPFTEACSAQTPANKAKVITDVLKKSSSLFPLLPNKKVGFEDHMVANFDVIFQLDRQSLDTLKIKLRKGRLSEVLYQPFREKLANYFRRYAFDETATLDNEMKGIYLAKEAEQLKKNQEKDSKENS